MNHLVFLVYRIPFLCENCQVRLRPKPRYEAKYYRNVKIDPVLVWTSVEMELGIYLKIIGCFFFKFWYAVDAENRVQLFSIHREEDCSDSGEFFTSSVRNTARVSPLVTCGVMKCFCNHHGLWVFSNYRNFKPSRRHPIISGFSIFELRGKSCESRKLNWRFLQLHSLRHVGSSETSVRSMSLYKRNSFFGSELLLTGSGLSLPLPLEFNSLAFTGGKAWALFPVSNFIGNFTCVGPPKGNSLIWNNPNISLTVGSIYFKCPKIKNFTLPISTDYLILYKNSSEGRGRNESRADEGIPSLFFDGKEIRLPVAEIFVEFSIAGSEKWTIYSGLDFNGKSRCLVKFGQKRLGNDEIRRFRFKRSNTGQRIGSEAENDSPDFGETWLIGSIRYGCFSSSSTQHEEDYEDQLYDYYERTPAVEDDDKSIEWNTTTRNVSAPDSKNQGHSYYIREGEYSKELIKLSLPIFSLLFNNVIMSIVL